MTRDRLEAYLEFVRPRHGERDAAHDFRHIERIVARLEVLSEGVEPAPRRERLYFLACFHGLAGRMKSDEALRGETEAFLGGLGWSKEEIREGFDALDRHLKDPQTVEEEIVHDANFVELLGAFGIAKAFTVGGARGQSYEETADIFEHRYLEAVEFRTPAGRRLAEEGREYAREFLRRLRCEL
jgi:hypothetical protein